MNILLCGAAGFLGQAIASHLEQAGHRVIRGVHQPRQPGDLALDYRADLEATAWLPRLAEVDAVVNAVGILHERANDDFARIHQQAPTALFEACAQAGVARVLQISALGCAEPPPYLSSKHGADAALLRLLPGRGVVLRPGLVFGAEGASTRFFLGLASLPLLGCPAGAGQVQPVHVEDVAEAVLRLLEMAEVPAGIINLPGPRALGFVDWLETYRRGMGLAPALHLPIPAPLMAVAARLAGGIPGSLLSSATWGMLSRGNVADPAPAQNLLGRPLRDPAQFITPDLAEPLRLGALALWRRPLLLLVLASIWLLTALVSAGLHPLASSLELLAPFGLSGTPALLVLAAATLLDLVMGLLTLWRPGRRLWLLQLALIGGYSLLIAWKLPEFLLHPFGPLLKNLAVAALIVQLLAEERQS